MDVCCRAQIWGYAELPLQALLSLTLYTPHTDALQTQKPYTQSLVDVDARVDTPFGPAWKVDACRGPKAT